MSAISKHDFKLEIDEEEFQAWYKTWREEGMPISPTNTSFEFWMGHKIDKEFSGIKFLLGQTLWYSLDQENSIGLCTDVYFSGVIIKNGKVTYENHDSFYIEGYDKEISKKELSEHVFASRSSLLYSLNYDGSDIYDGRYIINDFLDDSFILEQLLY